MKYSKISIIVLAFLFSLLMAIAAPAECQINSITAPSGGEDWAGTQTISWSYVDQSQCTNALSLEVKYSPDGGNLWRLISSLSNVTSVSWNSNDATSHDGDGSQYLIKISECDGSCSNDVSGLFTIDNTAPVVVINVPNPCAEGSTITINSSGSLDATSGIASYAWDTDGDGYDDGAASTVSYTCGVSGLYDVALNITDNAGNYGNATAVVNVTNLPPVVNVLYPNGTEYLGGNVNILWNATDSLDVLTIDLEYSEDGSTWVPIAAGETNDGNYTWDTTGLDNTTFKVRVTADDGTSTSLDTSDTNFTLDNTNPFADIGDDAALLENETYTLNASNSTDIAPGNSSMLVYEWDFDNDGNYDNAVGIYPVFDPTNTSYATANFDGVYLIKLKVTDGANNVDYDNLTLNVTNIVPSITVTYPNGGENTSGIVDINWTANDPVDTLLIDLDYWNGSAWVSVATDETDDGTYDWNTTPLALDNNIFKVRVTAKDGTNQTSDASDANFSVDSVAPVAEANGAYACNEGSTVVLTSNGSDGGTIGINSVDWDLDNDSVFEVNGVNATFTCSDDGVFTVNVRVTDNHGQSSVDSSTVTVSNVAPVISAESNRTVVEGAIVTVNNTFTDVGSADTHFVNVDWGDGNGDGQAATAGVQLSINYTYADNGVYIVVVNVTDDNGGWDTDTFSVNVTNAAPVLNAGNAVTINESESITLNATFTDAGTADTHSAVISWGDGSTDTIVLGSANSPINNSHTYVDDGAYTVNVTVVDDDGASVWDSLIVTVTNLAPSVLINTPADSAALNGVVNINWSVVDLGNDSVAMFVDYSNDNGVTWNNVNSTNANPYVSGSFDYDWDTSGLADGTYLIRVNATDDNGIYSIDTVTGLSVDNTGSTTSGPEVAPNPVVIGQTAKFTGHVADTNPLQSARIHIEYDNAEIANFTMVANDGTIDESEEDVYYDANTALTGSWVAGTYHFWIEGKDAAGNWQGKTGSNTESFTVISSSSSAQYTKAEIDAMITNLNTSINENEANITILKGDVSTLQGNVTTLNSDMTAANNNITALWGDVNTLNANVSNLTQDIDDVDADVVVLRGRVDSINGTVQGLDSRIDSVNSSVQILDTDLGVVQGNITTLDSRVSTLETTVATHTAQIAAINGNITALYADDAALSARLDAVNASLNTQSTDVNNIRANVTTLQGDMLVVQGNVTILRADLTTLDGNVTTLQTDFNNLKNKVNAFFAFTLTDNTEDVWATNGAGVLNVSTSRAAVCTYTDLLNKSSTGVMATAAGFAHTQNLVIEDLSYFKVSCVDNAEGFSKETYIFVEPEENNALEGFTKTVLLRTQLFGFLLARSEYENNPALAADYSVNNMMGSVNNWLSVSEFDYTTDTWKYYVDGIGGTLSNFSASMGYYVIELNSSASQQTWDVN